MRSESFISGWFRAALICGGVLVASGCGDDEETKPEPCPMGTAVNQTQAYPCGDGGSCNRTCQVDMTLTECVCGGGEAGSGAAGTSAAGTGAGTGAGAGASGTGQTSDDDAGTEMTDSGMSMTDSGGGTTTPDRALEDGSQLAACTGDADCEDDRVCYLGSAATGFCTGACTIDDDCMDLTGATYTCSVSAGACRIECTGEDDDSCPALMTCQMANLGGVYRCAYEEKSVGSGDVAIYGACDTDGDCSGDLLCYGGFQGGLAGNYKGYCTPACESNIDCTEDPTTGNVAATCGSGLGAATRTCRLDCGVMLGDPEAECPDGMECVNLGPAGQRCMIPE
jgi:hypothetical protein